MYKITSKKSVTLAFLTCFAVFASITVHAAHQHKTLRFTSSVGMPFSNAKGTGFEDLLLKEICRRIGRRVSIRYVPSERALSNIEAGIDDGALARVSVVVKKYPKIVLVKEPAFIQEFVAFSKLQRFVPRGWASLVPYNIGIVAGWKILEKHIRHTKSLVETSDGKQLFRLLQRGRIDLAVYNRWSGVYLCRKMHFDQIHALSPPLAKVPIYFLLSEKNADLAEPMRRALISIKADGTYQNIYNKTLKQYHE